MQAIQAERTYTAFFLFGGLGGGALGAQWAAREFRGVQGRCEVLGSIDNDPDACADFETLTGVPATVLDLFDREQYRDWHHGKEPPTDWQEVTLEQIRAAAQNRTPDVVVVTAPCKGFSGLLSEDKSQSRRYQALNKLTFRGVFLTLEAWRDSLPGVILFENVPRIATRGKRFLSEIKRLLQAYGYLIDDRHHNCGEHGLAQNRRRYLLIARQVDKVPHFVYNTPKLPVRPIGDVIEPMPMPDDPGSGPLHRLPRLQWRTWLRLALIPPRGDWRDLQGIEAGRYRITQEMNGKHTNKYRVYDSTLPAGTVTGSDRLGSGAPAVADVRLADADGRHPMKYRVQDESNPAATVIGQTDVQAGAPIVADHRQAHLVEGQAFPHKYEVLDANEPGPTVTGSRMGSGAPAIADMRLGHTPMGNGTMGVTDMSDPAPSVVAASDIHNGGAGAVADPRIPDDAERGVWIIVSPHTDKKGRHCWHRPLTTLELLALQGFPTTMPDGSPVILAGKSDRAWRERIGNALPPPSMKAIMEEVMLAYMASEAGTWAMDEHGAGIWVQEPEEMEAEFPA